MELNVNHYLAVININNNKNIRNNNKNIKNGIRNLCTGNNISHIIFILNRNNANK